MPLRIVLSALALLALTGFLVLTRGHAPEDFTPPRNPDAIVGKAAPDLSLPTLDTGKKELPRERKGQVTVIHFFASWCLPCRAEQPLLAALTATGVVFVGIDYKDKPQDAKRFLADTGNPYHVVLRDTDGRAAASFALTGVPETYIVDRNGIIRFRQAGPLTETVIASDILPLLKRLQQR